MYRHALRILGKGGHERVVPMRPDVLASLHAMGLPRAGRLFRRDAGGGFTGEQMSRWLNGYLHGTADVDASAHQLRHWFGSRAYEECRDLRVVQELLGHASPTTTAVYTAFSPVVQAEAVLRLPAVSALR